MPTMRELEGKTIQAAIAFFNKDGRKEVKTYKLHQVEAYGMWVENQEFTEKVLGVANATIAQKTFVAFVPWSEVVVVYSSVDSPSLSEKLLE